MENTQAQQNKVQNGKSHIGTARKAYRMGKHRGTEQAKVQVGKAHRYSSIARIGKVQNGKIHRHSRTKYRTAKTHRYTAEQSTGWANTLAQQNKVQNVQTHMAQQNKVQNGKTQTGTAKQNYTNGNIQEHSTIKGTEWENTEVQQNKVQN